MSNSAPSITPARDAAERAIADMKTRMAAKQTETDLDRLGIDFQVELTSVMVRFLGDMADRQASPTEVFSLIEAGLAGGISSVLLSFTAGDRGKAADLLDPVMSDVSNMALKRIAKTDSWEVSSAAVPQARFGCA